MPFFEPGKNVTMRYMFNAGEAGEPKNNSDEDVVGESSKDSVEKRDVTLYVGLSQQSEPRQCSQPTRMTRIILLHRVFREITLAFTFFFFFFCLEYLCKHSKRAIDQLKYVTLL